MFNEVLSYHPFSSTFNFLDLATIGNHTCSCASEKYTFAVSIYNYAHAI